MDTLNKTRVDVVPDPRSPSTQMSVGELRVWLVRLVTSLDLQNPKKAVRATAHNILLLACFMAP